MYAELTLTYCRWVQTDMGNRGAFLELRKQL